MQKESDFEGDENEDDNETSGSDSENGMDFEKMLEMRKESGMSRMQMIIELIKVNSHIDDRNGYSLSTNSIGNKYSKSKIAYYHHDDVALICDAKLPQHTFAISDSEELKLDINDVIEQPKITSPTPAITVSQSQQEISEVPVSSSSPTQSILGKRKRSTVFPDTFGAAIRRYKELNSPLPKISRMKKLKNERYHKILCQIFGSSTFELPRNPDGKKYYFSNSP